MQLNPLHEYDELLTRLVSLAGSKEARAIENRTETTTYRLFAQNVRVPLDGRFPWPTRKKLLFRPMVGELRTFLQGGTTLGAFKKNGCHFWDPWGSEEHLTKAGIWQRRPEKGNLGPIYGSQWRDFNGDGIDQLEDVINKIIKTPFDRRMIVTAWNPSKNADMALPPCHLYFQFFVSDCRRFLNIFVLMRSADMFVGVPFNIGSYALLTHLVCGEVNKRSLMNIQPGELVLQMVDCHLYSNHVDAAEKYLSRDVRHFPRLSKDPAYVGINEWLEKGETSNIQLLDYTPHPAIPVKVAV